MSASQLILNIDDFCVLSGEVVDKILMSCNPDSALLYLYMTREKKNFSEANAIKALNFGKTRYDKAIYDLVATQVITQITEKKNSINYTQKPKYTTQQLAEAREDQRFFAICQAGENIIGKALSESYVKAFLYIYDSLKLPAEVIIEMLYFLKDKTNSPLRRMDIEREAHLWVDMGIATYNDATTYISNKFAEKPLFDEMMSALKIFGRDPQPVEERYILHFINYGFTADVVALAVDRMQAKINKFSFQYLNKILLRYKENNLFTVADIIASDPTYKTSNIIPKANQEGELQDWEIEFIKENTKEQ